MNTRSAPRPFLFSLLLLAICLAIATGCGEQTSEAATKPPSPAEGKDNTRGKDETLVNVTPLKRGPISSYIEVTADIESLDLVDVFPEIGGMRITELAVDEGDIVERGDLLVKLDDEEIMLELRQTEVELKEAIKQKEKAAVAVDEAEERRKASGIQKEKLLEDYQASLEIARDGLVSDKDLSSDRLAWEQAASDCALRAFEHARAILDADLAEAAAEKAAIRRDNAALKVKRTFIRAPIDGCISFRDANVGKSVMTSARLFSIVDSDDLVANAFLPQEDISRIREGMPVTFTCDADPDRVFSGKADLVSPVVDPTNGTVKVRVRIETDKDRFLRPGMFINARVLVFFREDAMLVTCKAVFYENESPCFFVVEKGVAHKVIFDRGAATDEVIEVLNARYADPEDLAVIPWEEFSLEEPHLHEGMAVVVVGQDNLKEGDSVEIVEELP
jgi:multidrug resistance efflux pump